MFKYRIFILSGTLLLAYTVIVCRMFNVSVFDETRARNQIFGDGYSDINTLSSAWYFKDSGFTKTAFLPVHEYKVQTKQPAIYTHYPALPNILAGAAAVVLNSYNEPLLRLLPVLLSLLLAFFIYRVLHRLIPDKRVALLATVLLYSSNYFIAWADNLHQHLYGELLKWLSIAVMMEYYEKGRNQLRFLLVLCIIMLLQVNISFEQPVFFGILAAGFAWHYQRNVFTRETVLLFVSLCAGFLLHMYQNKVYFGSWQLAIDDLTNAFVYRTTGQQAIQGGHAEETFSWVQWLTLPADWLNRMERFFVLPGWFVLVVYILFYKKIHTQGEKSLQLIWVFLAAGIAWSVVMPQHAFIHSFTSKHFAVWYAPVAASGLYLLYQHLRNTFSEMNWWKKVFYVCLIGYACIMFITQHVWELYLKFGVLYTVL
jgi:hypothetical protein